MEIALLGADQESILLATAAVNRGHQLVWAGDVDWAREEYRLSWLPEQDQLHRWEALLDGDLCDAVILGQGSVAPAARQEQLAVLLKNDISVLTSFPLMTSVLSYYEIDMVRNETNALLRCFNPLTEPQEIYLEAVDWMQTGQEEVGRIEQVQWERPLNDRSRERLLWHFARDVSLLEQFAGRFDRVGAHGPAHDSENWSALSVQLMGKSLLPVQWMVRPGGTNEACLTLSAEGGELAIRFDAASRPVELTVQSEGESRTETLTSNDPSDMAIERLEQSLSVGGDASNWSDALHSMELADTIEISLRRGRMIDVHNQQLTEDLAFRGTMSALGCGVIMILPPLLLLMGWLAELAGISVAEYWPHVLLALLSLFLALQFLPKLFAPAPTEANSAEAEDDGAKL